MVKLALRPDVGTTFVIIPTQTGRPDEQLREGASYPGTLFGSVGVAVAHFHVIAHHLA